MKRLVAAMIMLAACHKPDEPKRFGPRFYSGGKDARRVQCSKGIDRGHEWPHEQLAASIDYARSHAVVLHTFGHAPTIDLNEYLADFDAAAEGGVLMVTFRDLAAGFTGAGWAFTVDDDEVDTWYAWRDTLRAHHVHVTFFVTNFAKLTPAQLTELHELAADGHDIEAHGVAHQQAVEYVAAHGMPAYVKDEVLPSKDALVLAGFEPPLAFAYPYGAHTAAIDDALLPYFKLLRTTGAEWCLKDADGAAK